MAATDGVQLTLRERTRLAMRAEVSEVAFRLFAERGFDGTTVDQIAAEAGLSRTTFFRYFGTKEEIVLGRLVEIGHQIAAELVVRPQKERPWEALRRAFDVVTQAIDGDPERSLVMMRLLIDACALMTRDWEKTQGWQSLLAPEIARRLGADAPNAELQANALVASAISCFDSATGSWAASEGKASLSALLDTAMATLSALK
ncbi:hypothetical protein LMG919_04210 [Xanthomonas vesicatoria]|nr:hypothetical protein LMG919_04210 [Xanthomonas vesicatoria]